MRMCTGAAFWHRDRCCKASGCEPAFQAGLLQVWPRFTARLSGDLPARHECTSLPSRRLFLRRSILCLSTPQSSISDTHAHYLSRRIVCLSAVPWTIADVCARGRLRREKVKIVTAFHTVNIQETNLSTSPSLINVGLLQVAKCAESKVVGTPHNNSEAGGISMCITQPCTRARLRSL